MNKMILNKCKNRYNSKRIRGNNYSWDKNSKRIKRLSDIL
jgi:hypothetical protein